MSNFYNRYFGENNNSDNESNEEQQQRRRLWTQQLTSSQAIEPINRSILPNINNEDNTDLETIEATNRIIVSFNNNENLETTEENLGQNLTNQTTDNLEE